MGSSIAVLAGDGVGVEVVRSAVQVLLESGRRHDLDLHLTEHPAGGQALDEQGHPLPESTLQACLEAGIVLLGAVGDPRFDSLPPSQRPEQAILGLRSRMQLFANLRPIVVQPALREASSLKPHLLQDVDILFVRELTGGIYFGQPRGQSTDEGRRKAFNTEVYFDFEVERIARKAFDAARNRRGRVTSVDKSNVLESSQLWRKVVCEVGEEFPDVELEHMFVDNCAMQLVRHPSQFDVVLTTNMFGDILSDEAAMIAGSLGMLPSASLGQGSRGLYEPVHGSAPDIAGQDKANPMAAIASVALLMRHSLGQDQAAAEIEGALERTLSAGYRTPDIASSERDRVVGTREMTDAVLKELDGGG